MIKRIVPMVAIAALFFVGCQEAAGEKAGDTSETRKEANERIADVRKDANQTILKTDENESDAVETYASSDAKVQANLDAVEADAMSEEARAEYYLTMATARGHYQLAAQECHAFDRGAGRAACKSTADAALATASADATARRDVVLLAAQNHE